GRVTVDGQDFVIAKREVLYIGRETCRVTFESLDTARPACFYLNSVSAGTRHPHRLIRRDEAKKIAIGDSKKCNYRNLAMYIHPEVAPSCLLMLGITDVNPGNNWNTMPPHLHERRMEAYLYFDIAAEDRVFHFMGRPEETRHLTVADRQAVLSPSWSIHMGVGTGPYSFIWGMTGENQAYTDVTPLAPADLL
ncbi:MAG: 5-dehydro-4-deoxy-D-glucuronate isomerase, partial [Clostridiaceae bacterium]|nr:5-dehydro-4-deoxy-D-glucuronate isomerase [Clostridiaceae bacterium]